MNTKQYIRHFLTMFSGAVLAQGINLAAYPVITRRYLPADMGEFSVFIATVAIIGALACGRFDAVIQAAKFHERFAVFSVSQKINKVVSLGASVIFLGIALLTDMHWAWQKSVLLGIAIFAIGYCNTASLFLIKHEEYKLSATSVALRTGGTALPQIVLYYLFPNAMGLIVGFVIGLLTQMAFLKFGIRTRCKWRNATVGQRNYIRQRYKIFLYVDVPGQALGVVSLNTLNYFVLSLFGNEEVGYYAISYRLAALPLGVITRALSNVFFQKGAKAYTETGKFWTELRFNLYSSIVLSLPIYSFAMLIAKPITKAYLGEQWLPAADVLFYLAPMLGIRFVSGSIGAMPLIVGRPQILLLKNFLIIGAMCTSFGVARYSAYSLSSFLILNTCLVGFVEFSFILYVVYSTKKHYS